MNDNIFDIKIEGLDPVLEKFKQYPRAMNKKMNEAMRRSLTEVQQATPGYPPQRENQKTPYVRTGTLARSLGTGMSGGVSGKPSIYAITGSGNNMQGQVGTNLVYAKYVIGDKTQAKAHRNWWWTFDFVARKAKDKIVALWDRLIKEALDI